MDFINQISGNHPDSELIGKLFNTNSKQIPIVISFAYKM